MYDVSHKTTDKGQNLLSVETPLVAFATTVDGDLDPHEHDFLEIMVVASGSGDHVCQTGKQTLGTGSAVVLRPGAWHAYRRCHKLAVYNICIDMDYLNRDLDFGARYDQINYLLWSGPLGSASHGLLTLSLSDDGHDETMNRLADLSDACAAERGRTPSAEVLARLLLALSAIGSRVAERHEPARPTAPHPAALSCRALMENDCGREWTLAELADSVHLAPEYLVRQFKLAVGISPIAFLNRYRAERAAAMLLRTEEPVSAIGESVGWPDASYFSRAFRKAYGVSPTEYRRRARR